MKAKIRIQTAAEEAQQTAQLQPLTRLAEMPAELAEVINGPEMCALLGPHGARVRDLRSLRQPRGGEGRP